jgi:hypothetical protein
MSWNDWLKQGNVEKRLPDAAELRDLLKAARRQLEDAAVPGLSAEARFQLAYTGVLALATAAIRAAGYRLRSGEGHHRRSFEAAAHALGADAHDLTDFFELCRRKRNVISYEGSEASESEAKDLLQNAASFEALVTRSIERRHRR